MATLFDVVISLSLISATVLSEELLMRDINDTTASENLGIVHAITQDYPKLHIEGPSTGDTIGFWEICGPYGCADANKVCGDWGCVSTRDMYPPWLLPNIAPTSSPIDNAGSQHDNNDQPHDPLPETQSGCPIINGHECCGAFFQCPPFAEVDMSLGKNLALMGTKDCPGDPPCCGAPWQCGSVQKGDQKPLERSEASKAHCPVDVNGRECCGRNCVYPPTRALWAALQPDGARTAAQQNLDSTRHCPIDIHGIECCGITCVYPRTTVAETSDSQNEARDFTLAAQESDVDSPPEAKKGLNLCGPWGCIPVDTLPDHLRSLLEYSRKASNLKSEL